MGRREWPSDNRADEEEMVRPLSMARVLRPLPGVRGSGQPALATLGYEGLAAVGGRGQVASENIAQILAERSVLQSTAWLRIEPLDVEPRNLANSLLRAAAHALSEPNEGPKSSPPNVDSPSEAGRFLAEQLARIPVLILEDSFPSRATMQVWESLIAFRRHASPGSLVVYLCHGPLRRGVVSAADVVIDGNGGRHPELDKLLVDGDSGFSVSALARFMSQAGNRPSLLNDVLDANAKRDTGLVTHLGTTTNRYRSLEHRINARLLPQLSPAELQALSIASQTRYWHISLSDQSPPPDMTLRPWMLPLESGWWWLRPAWRPSLTRSLDASRRSGRRFFLAYRTKRPAVGTPPSLQEPEEQPSPATAAASDSAGNSQSTEETLGDVALDVVDTAAADDPPSGPAISARMFGTFESTIDGRPVPDWHGRLGRSIFAYLLLQQQGTATKEQLIDVFWPDVEPASAQNRLRVAVWSLRKSLKAATDRLVIEFHDGNYRVNPNSKIRIDVDDFELNAKEARDAEAASEPDEALAAYSIAFDCYRADLLSDMAYEEWTLLPREALRVSYLECLSDAASLHMDRGDHGAVLRLAWAILAADPLREDAHRLIMRCQAAKGQPHQSVRQFELCRHELATTLGVEPAPATIELIEAIRNGDTPEP